MGPLVAADILRRAPTPAPPRVSRRQTRLPGRLEKSGARAGARCADRPPPSRGGLSPSHGLARGIAPWPCGSKAIASAAICSCPQSRKPLDAHDRFRGGRSMTPPRSVCAPVAQLDRAPDYESGGREFESLRARQQFPYVTLAQTVLERSLERCLERRFQVRIKSDRSSAASCLYARCFARCAAGTEMPRRSDAPTFVRVASYRQSARATRLSRGATLPRLGRGFESLRPLQFLL